MLKIKDQSGTEDWHSQSSTNIFLVLDQIYIIFL